MIGFSVRTSRRGPLFDFRARRALNRFVDAWEEETAEEALEDVQRTYATSFKNPTGHYAPLVRVRHSRGHPEVSDDGRIAYGPWLEGVGSRNAASRFKGYHAFRNAARKAELRARGIGQRLLDRRYLRQMS